MRKTSEAGKDYLTRVLVVYDDSLIRGLLYTLFESEGYEVLAGRSGVDALTILGQSRRPIDLLVTDLRIPELSGERLAQECLFSGRQLRILYVSGPCDCEASVLESELLKIEFVAGPYRADELLRTARELLLAGAFKQTPHKFVALAAGSQVM